MKNKTALILVLVCVILSGFCANVCFAQNPEVAREYISRKIAGEKSREERLSIDFSNLLITNGSYLEISFFDDTNTVLEKYELGLDFGELAEQKFSVDKETLAGASYIEIKIVGQDNVYDGVKLPFKI